MAFTSDSPIDVLFEDDELVAVHKPVGLVVDAGRERSDSNSDLISALTHQGLRTFAFHRLDRDTSGIVLLGKLDSWGKAPASAKGITQAFEEKRIRKGYLAVVRGEWPSNLNKIEKTIDEKSALTTFRRLGSNSEYTVVEALPKTGRKHQIRIHCASMGHPVAGDAVYGPQVDSERTDLGHALHSYSLSFKHPKTNEAISIRCEPKAWRESWLRGFTDDEYKKIWATIFK